MLAWIGSFTSLVAVLIFGYLAQTDTERLGQYWPLLLICFILSSIPIMCEKKPGGDKKDGYSFKGMERGTHQTNVWTGGRRPRF